MAKTLFGFEIRRARDRSASRGSLNEQASDHPSSSPKYTGYFEALDPSLGSSVPSQAKILFPFLQTLQRQQLSGLARWLYDNHPLVGYAVDLIKLYSTPIIPQALVEDVEIANQYEDYFSDWSKRCEFTGQYSFPEVLKLMSIALDTDGDMGAIVTKENGFEQIQLIDGGLIQAEEESYPSMQDKPPEYIDGVKLDAKGRVVGYSLRTFDPGKFKTYRKSSFFLAREPDRSIRFRGISPLRRGASDMVAGSDIKKFLKLAVKFDSAIMAVITKKEGIGEEDDWGDDEKNAPADDATKHDKKIGLADLIGGDIPFIDEGETIHQLNSNRPERNVIDFINLLAGHMVQGLGIPAAFFLDDRLTGPNQRAVNSKAQRRFDERQTVLCNFTEWVWIRVIGSAIDRGELPKAKNWYRCGFQRPPKLTIDSGREMAQEREDVAKGLMTRREHYGNRGKDWTRETDQVFSELDYLAEKSSELAKKHGMKADTIFNGLISSKSSKKSESKSDGKDTNSGKDGEK